MVCGLQLFRRLGEEEGAPVCDAADYAVLLEHDLAGGFGDSGVYWLEGGVDGGREREVLFNFGEAAGPDLELLVLQS